MFIEEWGIPAISVFGGSRNELKMKTKNMKYPDRTKNEKETPFHLRRRRNGPLVSFFRDSRNWMKLQRIHRGKKTKHIAELAHAISTDQISLLHLFSKIIAFFQKIAIAFQRPPRFLPSNRLSQ